MEMQTTKAFTYRIDQFLEWEAIRKRCVFYKLVLTKYFHKCEAFD